MVSSTDGQTDGRTDRQTDKVNPVYTCGGYNYRPKKRSKFTADVFFQNYLISNQFFNKHTHLRHLTKINSLKIATNIFATY